MKYRFLIIAFILSLCFASKSQTDYYFSDSSAIWYLQQTQLWFEPPPNNVSYFSVIYHATGVTTHNSQYYQVISGYHLRRDSTDKIFIYDNTLQADRLIYDFGLAEGDTFKFFNPIFNDTALMTVDSVDTVITPTPRKRMMMKCHSWSCSDDTLIDGIGSISSHFLEPLIDQSAVDGPSFNLLCFEERGQTYHFASGGCIVGIEGIDKLKKLKVLVSNKEIMIESTYNSEVTFSLADILGRICYNGKILPGETILTATNLEQGMYVWTIRNNEVILQSGKVILNR